MPKSKIYLVCYDIVEPKRWRKVYKTMKAYGKRLQYSIFKCHLTDKQLAEMRWKLTKVLDSKEDRLLIAPLHHDIIKEVFVINVIDEWDTERDRFLLL